MRFETPFVIGIAGGSASGKTTFAKLLSETFGATACLILHMDSYYKPQAQLPRAKAPVTGIEYADYNHPSSLHLAQLAQDFDQAIADARHKIIIIEGIFALQNESIYSKLDLKIFIDCRADERMIRRLKRNMGFGLEFDQTSDEYLDLVRYRHDEYVEPSKWRADLILNGSNFSKKAVDLIVNYIKNRNP